MLQHRLEKAAKRFLEPEDGHPHAEFLYPPGEPALAAHDSISWQVFKNPVALFIGGVAAVILELAEPRVRTGVWQNTSFKTNPSLRLKRTGLAAMMTVYGPRSQAEAMIAGIRRMHGRISGMTPDGQHYSANAPELLDWVHATASFGFLQAYHTYVRPLDEHQRNCFYEEGKPASELFGTLSAPASEKEINNLFLNMHDRLEASPVIFDFLNIMCRSPILPLRGPLRIVQKLLVMSAIALVPGNIRERLDLTGSWAASPWQLYAARLIAATADRILIRSLPAVHACRRMGLPDDYLYMK